jgi:hypothetical protein
MSSAPIAVLPPPAPVTSITPAAVTDREQPGLLTVLAAVPDPREPRGSATPFRAFLRWRCVQYWPGLSRSPRSRTGQVHLLSAYDTSSGVVLAQVQIVAKSNEIPAFVPLLDRVEDLLGDLNGVRIERRRQQQAAFRIPERLGSTDRCRRTSACRQLTTRHAPPVAGSPRSH